MNYGEYLKCENSYCENQKDKIRIDNKLIEVQQKIIKAKTMKAQDKYIKELNNLKVIKNHLVCMINNCRFQLLYNFKESLDLYKSKMKKQKEIPTIIKRLVSNTEKLLIKPKLTNKEIKEIEININNLFYYYNYLYNDNFEKLNRYK